MSPYKLQTYIRTTCYIKTNGKTYLKTYRMYQYLAKYNLLHDAQSGFRSNHSCQTALINIIDKWIEEMNNGNVNVVTLLDLN